MRLLELGGRQIKVAESLAEWDYRGPSQAAGGMCQRCECCSVVDVFRDDEYYCVGHCDRNAVHPPEDPDTLEADERAEYKRLKAKYEGGGASRSCEKAGTRDVHAPCLHV